VSEWTVTQWTCLVLGGLIVLHAIGGLITNPDFSVPATTAKMFVGLDFNGWHALLGIVTYGLGMVVSPNADLARKFAAFVVLVNLALGVWIMLTPDILGILYLPNAINDAVFHFGSAVLFALALMIDGARQQSAPA
jgi:hypothetical protein